MEVERFVRRFVALSDPQAVAVTLWVAHTHEIEAADTTARYRGWGPPALRLGKTLRWDPGEVRRWLESHRADFEGRP